MENEVQKFDPSTLMQGVKDRIKATFVSLIPDEQWEQMVKKEVDDFFNTKDREYNNRNRYSDFQAIVRTELEAEARKRLLDYISSPDFNTVWQGSGLPVATEFVKNMVVENSGAILSNFYAGMASMMISDFANQLRNRQY